MAVSATRWRQDTHSAPTNPYQVIRFAPTYPNGGGGYSAFGWSPLPMDGAARLVNSAAGILTAPGLSGLGAPLLPSFGGVARVIGAGVGILAGIWLANRNLGG